ncbi:hypothetical protein Ahy_B10g105564 [Arachis hypogaea]|uniref:Uncharacterized protein n=1 Tax=Arachis hypogaea TaxID=3818 RepID=A0A444X8C5_ARAHY|nr:hypothetical protein Ahy_B10g105564 [Arachis hypogaea]
MSSPCRFSGYRTSSESCRLMHKSAEATIQVYVRVLEFIYGGFPMLRTSTDLANIYSWGSVTLSWLYKCLCRVANRDVKNLAGSLELLQS